MNESQVKGQLDGHAVPSADVNMRFYVLPAIEIIAVGNETFLAGASISGGHKSADDDEELNAKGFELFDDEEEEE